MLVVESSYAHRCEFLKGIYWNGMITIFLLLGTRRNRTPFLLDLGPSCMTSLVNEIETEVSLTGGSVYCVVSHAVNYRHNDRHRSGCEALSASFWE